jgi:hypothetical protein
MQFGFIVPVIEQMTEIAKQIYLEQGYVVPTIFALTEDHVIYAQPSDLLGATISDEARISIHALIAVSMDALYVGRIDEMYAAERAQDEPPILRGEMAELAEYVPTIRTAIGVEAIDLRDDQRYLSVAQYGIDDYGHIEWRSHVYEEESRFDEDASRLGLTRAMAQSEDLKSEALPMDQIKELLKKLHYESEIVPIRDE